METVEKRWKVETGDGVCGVGENGAEKIATGKFSKGGERKVGLL